MTWAGTFPVPEWYCSGTEMVSLWYYSGTILVPKWYFPLCFLDMVYSPFEALMVRLSDKEVDILKFIRRSRHKATVDEIAKGLQLTQNEVEVFLMGMLNQRLINVARGSSSMDDAYYTNPERREEIYDLIG